MKRILNWQVVFGTALILLSALFYFIHYLIFRDPQHIFIYLIGDIAFVFVEVLLVTLVLHQLLHYREKKSMLKKLNMVIGAFFSEAGLGLLKEYARFDKESKAVLRQLSVSKDWQGKELEKSAKVIRGHNFAIDPKGGDLIRLKDFLAEKRQFLLGLLENPNLLEHESFTELLWAVFHLAEELSYRNDLKSLLETDAKHLAGDLTRVYQQLILAWLEYMGHLKDNYPYLFSLAMRTNPFDPEAKVEVV